jgi:hypothetical protein
VIPIGPHAGWNPYLIPAALTAVLAAGPGMVASASGTYEGTIVRIGRGTAHTIVRTDVHGTPVAIGVVLTSGVLDGLPEAAAGGERNVPYVVPMPTKGARTIVDHVVIDWEPAGHPPPRVYDVPHLDFHFYLVSEEERAKILFKDEGESGDSRQQPPAQVLPAGYVVPPGTAVSRMGVHAVNPSASEFHGQPFTASFLYGYYNKRQTFLEVMASLTFLRSKPSFAAPVIRPASYTKPGAYPSTYRIAYHAARDVVEVALTDFR